MDVTYSNYVFYHLYVCRGGFFYVQKKIKVLSGDSGAYIFDDDKKARVG